MKKRDTPSKEELIDLHITQRMSVVQMAKHYKTAFRKVALWLKEAEIEQQVNRPRGHTFKKTKFKDIRPPKEEILAHIEDGKTNQQIEQIYKVTNPVLKRWYKEYEIEREAYEGTKTKVTSRELLYDLHINQQKSIKYIAKELSTSYAKVVAWLHEYNIEQRLYQPKRKVFITKNQLEDMHIRQKMSFKSIAISENISDVSVGILAKEYGIDNIDYGIGQTSENELKVLSFIQEYYPNAAKGSLSDALKINKRKETVSYDIIIPEIKLIVEYDGIRWHNEMSMDPNRHFDKMKTAHYHGYSIINIFSDEWLQKPDIVKSVLRSKMGVINKKIYARNTHIIEITNKQANKFYEDNHLQGRSNYYSKSYGLKYNEELVAVMSFGRHHRENNNEIILKRFACVINTNVIGAASKLFKHYINNHPEVNHVKSWSDNRWSEGRLYKQLGFVFSESAAPRYSYVYPNETRKSAQSHTKRLIGCPNEISERDFLYNQGIYRIWDCGKKTWEWKRGA